MDETTAQRYQAIETHAQAVMACLAQEVEKLGIHDVPLKQASEAEYRLDKDPASGEYTLTGDWRDARGYKLGTLLFHADGTFYVEHDIVRPHPSKKQWFVEAVHAWGKHDEIRAEARLLPIPE